MGLLRVEGFRVFSRGLRVLGLRVGMGLGLGALKCMGYIGVKPETLDPEPTLGSVGGCVLGGDKGHVASVLLEL